MKRATVVKTLVTHLVDNFNPRPREEGDTHRKVSAAIATHFNPRPREEGDTKSTTFPSTKPISIHALVKRATFFELVDYARENISIHALVKRATNFCTVTGNRLIISIHALVKRATQARSLNLKFPLIFQSTPS